MRALDHMVGLSNGGKITRERENEKEKEKEKEKERERVKVFRGEEMI